MDEYSKPLILIGHWKESDSDIELPMPQNLVMPGWDPQRLTSILAYLKNAPIACSYMGLSFCRFQCGIDENAMGCSDLSDGTYVWPEGLAHYVETHSVCIPEFFVQHMEKNGFDPPQLNDELNIDSYDLNPWINWASRFNRSQLG